MLAMHRNFTFFKDFSPDEMDLLEPLFKSCMFHSGDVVFEQGEQAETLFLVITGTVAIHYKPYDGPEIVLTHIHENGIFGWSAVVESDTYTSSAVCETDCETICIRGADLRDLCLSHPDVGNPILDRLAERVSGRWKNAHQQVRAMIHKHVIQLDNTAPKKGNPDVNL